MSAQVGTPLVAETSATMSDYNRIYVYTGSEAGYIYGNWYFWNGASWESGGVYNAVVVETDTTLTQSGTAADAKVTGDGLTDLKNTNAYNVFTQKSTGIDTVSGVKFTVTSDTITAQRTATSSSAGFYNLFYSTSSIPNGMVAGGTYYVKFRGTNIQLVLYDRTSGSVVEFFRTTSDGVVTLPTTITSLVIRVLVVGSALSVGQTETVNYPLFLNTMTNEDITNKILPQGTIPNNTDFNNIKDFGIYFINGATTAAYVNNPLAVGSAGTLEVFSGKEAIVQRITKYSDGKIFVRTSTTAKSFSGRTWTELTNTTNYTYNNTYEYDTYENSYDITCSPTITSDTNNYLAASGGSTDRTGDIQTMLNTTGVCRLGPGNFYVTGVEIPDNGILTGCGNKTVIYLSGTANGYAVKLNNYCTIKDLKLDGRRSDSPSATVGSRHGILYQGTATDSSSASSTRKFRGVIDNVTIANFKGGGITCNSTGGQVHSNLLVTNCHIYTCDAGINIALYSEYHRFTNISAMNCYYGCICNGGNCNFDNCSFSGDTMGLLMDNSNGQSQNNSHGTFNACTFNHTGNNSGTAISLLGMASGESFTGCQIFYGGINIENSSGICFIGANMGNTVPISITNSIAILFSSCIIKSTSQSPLTQSGNTSLVFKDCYNRDDGSIYNPV